MHVYYSTSSSQLDHHLFKPRNKRILFLSLISNILIFSALQRNLFSSSFTVIELHLQRQRHTFITKTPKSQCCSTAGINRANNRINPYTSQNRRNFFLSSSKLNTSTSSYSHEEYSFLTVVELKKILHDQGLKVSGRKAELIERLQQQENLILTMPRHSLRKRKNVDDEKEEDVTNINSSASAIESSSNESSSSSSSKPKITGNVKASKKDKENAKKPKPAKTKVEPQRITEKDELEKLWNAKDALTNGSYTFKIMSWNVAGLRALLRKQPDALSTLASEHKLDVICLQEHKLQEVHLTDPKLKISSILKEEGYESHFSCSTVKKGYSGTCVFIKRRMAPDDDDGKKKKKQGTMDNFLSKKKKVDDCNDTSSSLSTSIGDIDVQNLIPINASLKMNKNEHDSEGRIVTIDFPQFTMTNLYVPNSGQALERLDYRTKSWDRDLYNYMKDIEVQRSKPVIWLGDLNVAHTWRDVWNDGAKHLAKQAGTTQEERYSFQQMLDGDVRNNGDDGEEAVFVDAFRYLYPDAKGHYSYWSQRAGNRAPNKGLRLDYFICSRSLMDDGPDKQAIVRDSYMIPQQEGSDHCPVVLEIELRK